MFQIGILKFTFNFSTIHCDVALRLNSEASAYCASMVVTLLLHDVLHTHTWLELWCTVEYIWLWAWGGPQTGIRLQRFHCWFCSLHWALLKGCTAVTEQQASRVQSKQQCGITMRFIKCVCLSQMGWISNCIPSIPAAGDVWVITWLWGQGYTNNSLYTHHSPNYLVHN